MSEDIVIPNVDGRYEIRGMKIIITRRELIIQPASQRQSARVRDEVRDVHCEHNQRPQQPGSPGIPSILDSLSTLGKRMGK
jgi:hypothetical protein